MLIDYTNFLMKFAMDDDEITEEQLRRDEIVIACLIADGYLVWSHSEDGTYLNLTDKGGDFVLQEIENEKLPPAPFNDKMWS